MVLIFFTFSGLFAQSTQSITVVKLKDGSAFIECETISQSNNYFSNLNSFDGEYWIGPQTNLSLQSALKKAVSWAKLNEEHQKAFDKEIIRIRVTDKEHYEFYRKYIPEFSKEAILTFYGYADGSFLISLTIKDDLVDISLESIEGINDLIKMLQGKSINKEIDDIFH